MRTSGVLLPVFSLPSPHGIGCFSKEAYEWVDFLKLAGQQYVRLNLACPKKILLRVLENMKKGFDGLKS